MKCLKCDRWHPADIKHMHSTESQLYGHTHDSYRFEGPHDTNGPFMPKAMVEEVFKEYDQSEHASEHKAAIQSDIDNTLYF